MAQLGEFFFVRGKKNLGLLLAFVFCGRQTTNTFRLLFYGVIQSPSFVQESKTKQNKLSTSAKIKNNNNLSCPTYLSLQCSKMCRILLQFLWVEIVSRKAFNFAYLIFIKRICLKNGMEIEEICRENADTQKQNIPSDVISTHCTMYITMHASTQPSVIIKKTKATLYLLCTYLCRIQNKLKC